MSTRPRLGFALKGVVEHLLEHADVEPHLSAYRDGGEAYITVHFKRADDEDDEDIWISKSFTLEDAVDTMLNDPLMIDHVERWRMVAADFRRLADKIEEALTASAKVGA